MKKYDGGSFLTKLKSIIKTCYELYWYSFNLQKLKLEWMWKTVQWIQQNKDEKKLVWNMC